MINTIKATFSALFTKGWGHGPDKETGSGVDCEAWQDHLTDQFPGIPNLNAIELIIDDLRSVPGVDGEDDYEGMQVYRWKEDFVKRLGFTP